MTQPDPVIDHLLDRLDALDPEAATDAAMALGWLVGEQGLEQVNQAQLQQFLWYELPFKWLTDADGHLRTAAALARFFDLAGMPRYAGLCRSAQTADIIRIYETDGADAGFRAFLRAGRRSGVLADDIDGFAWSDYVGPVELDALRSTAIALELAVSSNELVPGRKGWHRRQADIIRAHLERPRAEHFGESWLQAIVTERLARWQDDGRSLARSQLLAPIANQLLHPVDRPRGWRVAARRLRWLLQEVGRPGGLAVSASGALGPGAVARYQSSFTWWDSGDRVPLDVLLLQRFATRAGLVSRRDRRLVLTAAGATASADSEAMWDAVCTTLGGCDRIGRAPRRVSDLPPVELVEVALAVLLDGQRVSWERLLRSLHVVVTELGWGGADGRPPPRRRVEDPLFDLAVLGDALGIMRFRGSGGTMLELTTTGRAAARRALRERALAPIRRFSSGV